MTVTILTNINKFLMNKRQILKMPNAVDSFLLRIDGLDRYQDITLEQVYAALHEGLLKRRDQSDMVVMLTNASGFRYVEHFTAATLLAILKTPEAMKHHFYHASHGRLFAMDNDQSSNSATAFPPPSELGPSTNEGRVA